MGRGYAEAALTDVLGGSLQHLAVLDSGRTVHRSGDTERLDSLSAEGLSVVRHLCNAITALVWFCRGDHHVCISHLHLVMKDEAPNQAMIRTDWAKNARGEFMLPSAQSVGYLFR